MERKPRPPETPAEYASPFLADAQETARAAAKKALRATDRSAVSF